MNPFVTLLSILLVDASQSNQLVKSVALTLSIIPTVLYASLIQPLISALL